MTSFDSTQSPVDEGFTLVELVIAIAVLTVAMIGSSTVLVSSINATIYNRHVDQAMTIAVRTMETAVAFDCGGTSVDPRFDFQLALGVTQPRAVEMRDRFNAEVNRCSWHQAPSTVPSEQTANTCQIADGTRFEGWADITDVSEGNLGTRYFVVRNSPIDYCVRYEVAWRRTQPTVAAADTGRNAPMRLQREVTVQWRERNNTSIVRSRSLRQLSAISPDSLNSSQAGRISIAVANKKANVQMTAVGSDNVPMVYAPVQNASGQWTVDIPFLTPNTIHDYQIRRVPLGGVAGTVIPIKLADAAPVGCLKLDQVLVELPNANPSPGAGICA